MHQAYFSIDRKYRYWLEADLPDKSGVCLFLMLNPSKADEVRSDPTVTRCKGYARRWGYGKLWVNNIFALRSTDPKALKLDSDPVGPSNDSQIVISVDIADITVLAWGGHGVYKNRGREVVDMLKNHKLEHKLYCLGMTKTNQPKHPLYLRKDLSYVKYE